MWDKFVFFCFKCICVVGVIGGICDCGGEVKVFFLFMVGDLIIVMDWFCKVCEFLLLILC